MRRQSTSAEMDGSTSKQADLNIINVYICIHIVHLFFFSYTTRFAWTWSVPPRDKSNIPLTAAAERTHGNDSLPTNEVPARCCLLQWDVWKNQEATSIKSSSQVLCYTHTDQPDESVMSPALHLSLSLSLPRIPLTYVYRSPHSRSVSLEAKSS